MTRSGGGVADQPKSIEWALATVASTLATGSPRRLVSRDEVEEAVVMIVVGFRELGHEVILLPGGVWDLTSLAEGEDLAFARAVMLTILEHHKLEVVWEE